MRARAKIPRSRGVLFAALVFALFLPGCARNSRPRDSSTLTFLIETMPTNLDPRIGTDAFSQHMHNCSSAAWWAATRK